MGFPGDAVVKNLPANPGDARDVSSISESGNGNLLQYSCLENSINRGGDGLESMGSQIAGHY